MGKLSSGKVGDKFEAFVRVSFGLHVSDQCLEVRKTESTISVQTATVRADFFFLSFSFLKFTKISILSP